MPIPLNPKRCYWAELSYPFGMFFASTSKYILAFFLKNLTFSKKVFLPLAFNLGK